MQYWSKFSVEDFVQDPGFRRWVKEDRPIHSPLSEWLADHPEKIDLVEEAVSLVLVTSFENMTDQYDWEKREENISFITNQINAAPVIPFWRKYGWVAVVIPVVCLALSWLLWKDDQTTKGTLSDRSIINATASYVDTTLPDGSIVRLSAGSELQLAKNFGTASRQVILNGEAEFSVVKNKDLPFLVYAGGLVTRVYGTVFIIRAFNNETVTSVAVKEGKVSVVKEDNTGETFLVANQQTVFNRSKNVLTKKLVDKPLPQTDQQQLPVTFNDTPLTDVLKWMKTTFGIEIQYDPEVLTNCTLTAIFTNENLFEMLNIIAETSDSRYDVTDGQIIIYSKGCK